jgi:DNA/RNA endonuclease YhcR with UshA esterase domain
MPAPFGTDWDGNGVADSDDEWVELFNPTDQPVGLGGWQLTDESRLVYDLPSEIVIPSHGFVTLFQAQTGFALNNGGDTVTLRHPNGTVIDQFRYDHNPGSDDSWCRLPDGGPNWSDDCAPSPNQTNWEKPPAGPLRVSIFEAKRLTHDAWVKIKGRVTAPPGVLGVRTMYIQDESAGIMVYLPKNHGLTFKLGDKVEVVGNLRDFHGEAEIAVDERSDVDFMEAGSPPPPLPIVTTSLLEPYEGLLVQLQGQAVRFQGRTTMWIDDGTDPAQTYVRRSTGIRKPFITAGTSVTTIGVVSQYSEGTPTRDDYRLLLRYQTDLILPEPLGPPPALDWPILLPETGY